MKTIHPELLVATIIMTSSHDTACLGTANRPATPPAPDQHPDAGPAPYTATEAAAFARQGASIIALPPDELWRDPFGEEEGDRLSSASAPASASVSASVARKKGEVVPSGIGDQGCGEGERVWIGSGRERNGVSSESEV